MQSGARSELITFERSTETRRPGGGLDTAPATLGQAWAHAQWVRGTEADDGGAVREVAVYKFTVLTAAIDSLGITVKDRIVWNGDTYNIRERPRRLRDKPETEIVAEAGVTL